MNNYFTSEYYLLFIAIVCPYFLVEHFLIGSIMAIFMILVWIYFFRKNELRKNKKLIISIIKPFDIPDNYKAIGLMGNRELENIVLEIIQFHKQHNFYEWMGFLPSDFRSNNMIQSKTHDNIKVVDLMELGGKWTFINSLGNIDYVTDIENGYLNFDGYYYQVTDKLIKLIADNIKK